MKSARRNLSSPEERKGSPTAIATLARPHPARGIGFRSILASLVAALLLVASVCQVTAAPPVDAELQNHAWFESLEQPGGRHLLCCSIADCHLTASRTSQTGYEVAIENAWIAVPADRVLQNVRNPTGRAVVCYRHIANPQVKQEELRIYCFVRPPEV